MEQEIINTSAKPTSDKYMMFGTDEVNVQKTGQALFHNKETYKNIQNWGKKFNTAFDEALGFIIDGIASGEIKGVDTSGNFQYTGNDSDYINGTNPEKTKALKAAALYASEVMALGVASSKLTRSLEVAVVPVTTEATTTETTPTTTATTTTETSSPELTSTLTAATPTTTVAQTAEEKAKEEDDKKYQEFVDYMNKNFGTLKFTKENIDLSQYNWTADRFERWFANANFDPVKKIPEMLSDINGSTGGLENKKLLEATLSYLFARYPKEHFKDLGNGEYLLTQFINTDLGRGWVFNPKTKKLRSISPGDSKDILNVLLYEWQKTHLLQNKTEEAKLDPTQLHLAKNGGILKFDEGGNVTVSLTQLITPEMVKLAYDSGKISQEEAQLYLLYLANPETVLNQENTQETTTLTLPTSRWLAEDPRISWGNTSNIDYIALAKENIKNLDKAALQAKADANHRTVEQEIEGLKHTFNNETLWDTEDWIRFGNLINDVSSIGMSYIPEYGTAIAGVQGVISMGADLVADAMDKDVSRSQMLSNIASNAGLALVGMIPGGAGKVGKVVKTIKKLLPSALATIGGIQAISDPKIRASLLKALSGDIESITNDDWKNILEGMKAISFMHNNARGAALAYNGTLKNMKIPGSKLVRKWGEFSIGTPKAMEAHKLMVLTPGLSALPKTKSGEKGGYDLIIKGKDNKTLHITLTEKGFTELNEIAKKYDDKDVALLKINEHIAERLGRDDVSSFTSSEITLEPTSETTTTVIKDLNLASDKLKKGDTALEYLNKLVSDAEASGEAEVLIGKEGSTTRKQKISLENLKKLRDTYKDKAGVEEGKAISEDTHKLGLEAIKEEFAKIYKDNPITDSLTISKSYISGLSAGELSSKSKLSRNKNLLNLDKVESTETETTTNTNLFEGNSRLAKLNRELFLRVLGYERNSGFTRHLGKIFSNSWEMANDYGPLRIGILGVYNKEDLKAMEDAHTLEVKDVLSKKLKTTNGELDPIFKEKLSEYFPELKQSEHMSDDEIIQSLSNYVAWKYNRGMGKNKSISVDENGKINLKDISMHDILTMLAKDKTSTSRALPTTLQELKESSITRLNAHKTEVARLEDEKDLIDYTFKELSNSRDGTVLKEGKLGEPFGKWLIRNGKNPANMSKELLREAGYDFYSNLIFNKKYKECTVSEKQTIIRNIKEDAFTEGRRFARDMFKIKSNTISAESMLKVATNDPLVQEELASLDDGSAIKLVRKYLGKSEDTLITNGDLDFALSHELPVLKDKSLSERIRIKELATKAETVKEKLGVSGRWKNATKEKLINDIASGKLSERAIEKASKLEGAKLKNGGILFAAEGTLINKLPLDTIVEKPEEWEWYKNLYQLQELGNSDLRTHNLNADSKLLYEHNLNFDLGVAARKNDAYIHTPSAVGKDIQNFYDSSYKGENLDLFIEDYNKSAALIRKTWEGNTNHKANTETGLTAHNLLFKRMFNLRSQIDNSDLYNIGYQDDLEDIMGTSTWMRRMDRYKTEWENANDEEKCERIHQIKLSDGNIGYVYKKANGDIAKLDNATAENILSNIPVTVNSDTGQTVDTNLVNATFKGDKVSTTHLKIGKALNVVKNGILSIDPADVIALSRFLDNQRNNKKITNLALNFDPVLEAPINMHTQIIRPISGTLEAQRQAALMLARLRQNRSSDGASNVAAILEALNKSAQLQIAALLAADEKVATQIATADAERKKVHEYNIGVQNRNTTAQANYKKSISDIKASLLTALLTNENTYSMELEKRLRLKNVDLAAFADSLAKYKLDTALSYDPVYLDLVLKYQASTNTTEKLNIARLAQERYKIIYNSAYNDYLNQYMIDHNLGTATNRRLLALSGQAGLSGTTFTALFVKDGGSLGKEHIRARIKDNSEFNKLVQNGIKNSLKSQDNLSRSTILAIKKALNQ